MHILTQATKTPHPPGHRLHPATVTDSGDLPSALALDSTPITWQQFRATANSYTGVATLMIEAGIGLFNLNLCDHDLRLRAAYDLLQTAIGIVGERAQGEAEDDDAPGAESAPATPAPPWWHAEKPHLRCCEGFHDSDPAHADQTCFGPGWEVPTSLPPVDESDEDGSHFRLGISQHVDDDQPRIWVGVGDGRHGRHLTAAEARNLAAVLLDASEKAEMVA